ncbi:hypothetical protein [Citreimonas salinaria]|uniref:DUF7742 domain-containing protein n=1 Tax=Citreimonas salinaria TaxID=321339 RepID=A0A1H3GY89_9RHOB|nr:hypothetical protein [Citreimonas salinaria]SDY08242.1 hypothetical protein SAMN05444340_103116 [Citreimonas salinaria]
MRPLVHGDVTTAARVLLTVPPQCRHALAARMIHEAACADAYRLLTGRAHPKLGNGTLMSAALAHGPAPEPMLDNRDYLSCLGLMIDALLADTARSAQPAASHRLRARVA